MAQVFTQEDGGKLVFFEAGDRVRIKQSFAGGPPIGTLARVTSVCQTSKGYRSSLSGVYIREDDRKVPRYFYPCRLELIYEESSIEELLAPVYGKTCEEATRRLLRGETPL